MWIFLTILAVLFIALIVFSVPVLLLYIQARVSGAPASFIELLLMPLRKAPLEIDLF